MLPISFLIFLLTATLGTRALLYQFTNGFHEYETVFLYASDVTLILFLILSYSGVTRISKNKKWIPDQVGNENKWLSLSLARPVAKLYGVAFLLFAAISIVFAEEKLLALYQFIRLLVLIAMAFAVARIAQERKVFKNILAIIAILAVLQSVIGIAQFINQKAIGLSWLGESPISATDGSSSKIMIEGSRILRAYGLFPHPNILGAFLVLGLLAIVYFYLQTDKELYEKIFDWQKGIGENFKRFIKSRYLYLRIALAGGMFIVLTGLALTFSRSAWLTAAVSLLCFTGFAVVSRGTTVRSILRLFIILLASGYALVALFRPFILPRATFTRTEPAVEYRLRYNELALDLIKKHPWGVGIGNQVLYSVEHDVYQKFGMKEVWQWQPIHNLYLLIAAEIGIVGLIGFLGFVIVIFWRRTKHPPITNYRLPITGAMLITLLLIGFFDHFLWTIWQGRIMLWLVIGLAIANAQIKEIDVL